MKDKEEFTAYITKYALTRGILEVNAYTYEGYDMIWYQEGKGSYNQYAAEAQWFKDLESAKAHVEEMRAKKVASLKKSLEKMSSLKVKVIKC